MITHSKNLIELNKLCEQCKVEGHLLCYMSDIHGPTASKKDGFARYIIDKMIENGELTLNQPIIVTGFEKFTQAVGAYLTELDWTSELYAVSHAVPISSKFFGKKDNYSNTVLLVTEYTGHYPKEYSEQLAKDVGGVFIDQYSSLYGVEYYKKQAKEIIEMLPFNVDAFLNPNATGSTTLGLGSVLKDKFPNIKILCPDFVSSGNPNKGDDVLPPLLKGFEVELFGKKDVIHFLYNGTSMIDGCYFPSAWRVLNFGLTYLKNNPGSTVLLHIGG